jgi:hypothetical protein
MASKWLMMLKTKDSATEVPQDLSKAAEYLEAKEPIDVIVEKFFTDNGHVISERGRGFGERDAGAVLTDEQCVELYRIVVAHSAYRAGLIHIECRPLRCS